MYSFDLCYRSETILKIILILNIKRTIEELLYVKRIKILVVNFTKTLCYGEKKTPIGSSPDMSRPRARQKGNKFCCTDFF